MSLQSKLSRLEALSSALPGERSRVLEELRSRMQATLERGAPIAKSHPFHRTVETPFATEQTPSGALHVRIQRLSPAHRTGRASLACAPDASMGRLSHLALEPRLASCSASGALFLDTETTGLAGGAGTIAFLVGLAWWDGRSLVLEQLLVRVPGEELPMLERVATRLRQASLLITFNGKSFDLPLLRTRFVMARLPVPPEPAHLDLLHVARRVHGGRRFAPGCRLVALEREVLGFERQEDVEPADVSACYWHFLRTGEERALLGVVEHNAWDVVSMAALVGVYGEPEGQQLGALDLVGVAKALRRAGALDDAIAVANAAVERDPAPACVRARADIAKARGDRARALADFEALALACGGDALVHLELAKLYEHWAKLPTRALEWVMRGTGEAPERAAKRVERLARKVEQARQTWLREDWSYPQPWNLGA